MKCELEEETTKYGDALRDSCFRKRAHGPEKCAWDANGLDSIRGAKLITN